MRASGDSYLPLRPQRSCSLTPSPHHPPPPPLQRYCVTLEWSCATCGTNQNFLDKNWRKKEEEEEEADEDKEEDFPKVWAGSSTGRQEEMKGGGGGGSVGVGGGSIAASFSRFVAS